MPELYAHTPNDKGEWHFLEEHLQEVAELARGFADKFGAGDLAHLAGLWHDLGKINLEFQDYLHACAQKRKHKKVPHAIWGAALAYALIYKSQKDPERWKELALPIMGHHAGLDDCGIAATKLDDFLTRGSEPLKRMQEALRDMRVSITSLKLPPCSAAKREMFIRMLFSAVVDADYLNTEKHFDPEQSNLRKKWPSLYVLWQRLLAEQRCILNTSTKLNRIRKEVYESCLAAASGKPGLYRLTVPTGGGKTRSVLAFALEHALINKDLHQVIVAIPYTSIIDQTAQAYRDIFGEDAVLEHHSAVEMPENDGDRQDELFVRRRLATENWDAPLIVTTTVQLLESLFSNRPAKVRKLHQLSRAVIVLDEVQTLPPELLTPTLDVLKLLATPVDQGGYGSTVVLCTATQPVYDKNDGPEYFHDALVHEIVPQYKDHFAELKRVRYSRRAEALSWAALAEEIKGVSQVLVVLNTRKDALALVKALGDTSDVFHLSTLLCGAHRKEVLAEVRRRLDPKRPQRVRLISTQVVEAGVDLDFPIVYRAIGPLDRIVQAAGRCNREGKPKKGKVIIFEPAEGKAPGGPYKVGIEKARLLLHENPVERLHEPDLYREYFIKLFSDVDLDEKRIQSYREALNYPEVASRYRLIESDTVPVVVERYKDARKYLEAWKAKPNCQAWRALQPFMVNLFRYEVEKKKGWLEKLSDELFVWTGNYDEKLGLSEEYCDPSDLVR